MNVRAILLVFAFLITAHSCKEDEHSGKVVLDKILYNEQEDFVVKYEYDKNGILKHQEFYFLDMLENFVDYYYTNDLLVSKKSYQADSAGGFYQFSEATILYTADNKLSEVLLETVNREIHYKVIWANDLIARVDRTENNVFSYTEFEYSDTGNIHKFIKHSGDDSVDFILECEYDSYVNPIYLFRDPTDIVRIDFTNSSPNNVVSVKQKRDFDSEAFAITELTYTYSNTGLPITRVYKETVRGEARETLAKYFYRNL